MTTTKVIEIDDGWTMEPGDTSPVVQLTEDKAVVEFNAANKAGRIRLTFEGVLCTTFGYPNDEALSGHPLYRSGLSYYAMHEVQFSPWLDELTRRNQNAFPEWKSWRGVRHFALTFHDSTLEILADSYTTEVPRII